MRKLFEIIASVLSGKGVPFHVPLDMDVKVYFDNEVEVRGSIPLDAEVEINTEIETQLPMLGKIRIPVKGKIPIKLTVPVNTRMRAKLDGLTARVRDDVTVSMPLRRSTRRKAKPALTEAP